MGLAAIVAAVLMTIRTPYGDVVIELSDPKANVAVVVDGESIDITGLNKPLRLKAGSHGLTVSGDEFETVTQEFTAKNGEKEVMQVTLRKPAKGLDPGRGKNKLDSANSRDPKIATKAVLPKLKSANVEPEHRAAEWVLQMGGSLEVDLLEGGPRIVLKPSDKLPVQPFSLHLSSAVTRASSLSFVKSRKMWF